LELFFFLVVVSVEVSAWAWLESAASLFFVLFFFVGVVSALVSEVPWLEESEAVVLVLDFFFFFLVVVVSVWDWSPDCDWAWVCARRAALPAASNRASNKDRYALRLVTIILSLSVRADLPFLP
jgi:hypothetical protein